MQKHMKLKRRRMLVVPVDFHMCLKTVNIKTEQTFEAIFKTN
jgi:hypothetical protein